MNVYLVCVYDEYDNYESPDSIYSTLELAKQHASGLTLGNEIRVYEYELDRDRLSNLVYKREVPET